MRERERDREREKEREREREKKSEIFRWKEVKRGNGNQEERCLLGERKK